MSIEKTKEYIKIMQAYLDGQDIEVRHPNATEWTSTPVPSWDFEGYFYRVKKKPREYWVLVTRDGRPIGVNNRPEYVTYGGNDQHDILGSKVIKVREVSE